MAAPTLTYYRVTSQGNTYPNSLAHWNVTGGPQGISVGTGATEPAWDFGSTDGGVWCLAHPLILQWDGNTANTLTFRLYNTVSNLEDFTSGTPWDFRIKLYANWVDPATITDATKLSWDPLPMGVNVAGYSLDSNMPNPGNDGTTNLLVPHATVGNRYLSNFYIYIAIKPSGTAIAGQDTGWAYRLTAKYPGA